MNSMHSGRFVAPAGINRPGAEAAARPAPAQFFLLVALLACLFPLEAKAQTVPAPSMRPPATVLLLSPAEGPVAVAPNFATNQASPLTSEGYARAKDLPQLFTGANPPFPRPDALFASHLRVATQPRSKKNKKASVEPAITQPVDTAQTLESVAKTLNLTIEETYSDDDFPYLANVLLSGEYAGKVVLVVWHPSSLDKLAAALGVVPAPAPWPATQADRVWRIDWPQSGTGKPTFRDMPQQLLPGDSK